MIWTMTHIRKNSERQPVGRSATFSLHGAKPFCATHRSSSYVPRRGGESSKRPQCPSWGAAGALGTGASDRRGAADGSTAGVEAGLLKMLGVPLFGLKQVVLALESLGSFERK